MKETDEILIRVFAATAAVWRPCVRWDLKTPRNTYFARVRYRQHGIRWASGKADDSQRQAASRALTGVDGGKLTATKAGGRTCFVKLTVTGVFRAAALCGLPGLAETLDTMRRLASFDEDPRALAGYEAGYIAEDLLLGWVDEASGPKGKQEFLAGVCGLSDRLLLALVREWVESNSDGRGRVYYRLTEAGRLALDNPPASPKRLPRPTDEAQDLFCEATEAARNEIETAAKWGPPGELGMLPISCSPSTRGTVKGDKQA